MAVPLDEKDVGSLDVRGDGCEYKPGVFLHVPDWLDFNNPDLGRKWAIAFNSFMGGYEDNVTEPDTLQGAFERVESELRELGVNAAKSYLGKNKH